MDDQNQNPMPISSDPPNPLENALKQIQGWFVSGDFEKVKKGCEEVLKAAPNNSIAQDLLKKAEEALSKSAPIAAAAPNAIPNLIETQNEPQIPQTPPSPESTSELHIPDSPIASYDLKMPQNNPLPSSEPHEEEHHKTHSLIANLVVLLLIIGIGIGAVFAYYRFFKNTRPAETVQEESETNNEAESEASEIEESSKEEISPKETENNEAPEEKQEREARNTQRLADLTSIEEALIQYYDTARHYPTVETINTVLVEQELIETMPTPPTEGEVYFYALYDNEAGVGQVYILSAEFENNDGSKEVWATGGNVLEYTDFQDVNQAHVTILHPSMSEEDYLANGNEPSEDSTQQENTTEAKERVPRM